MSKRRKIPVELKIQVVTRYQCPQCEQVLDEGQNRCDECHRFGRRVDGFECPHCGEFITDEDL